MRKILSYITYILCAALWLPSCRDNDGDIGPLFGLWSLQEVTVDGKLDPAVEPGNTFFSFQSSIVQVTGLLPHNDAELRTGTWHLGAGMLVLDFSHRDNTTEPSQHEYAPPTWIYITDPVTRLDFSIADDKSMRLSQGRYSYFLVKVL